MLYFIRDSGDDVPRNSSDEEESPRYRDDSDPVAILVRRSRWTGRFAKLLSEDRQLYFAFVAER